MKKNILISLACAILFLAYTTSIDEAIIKKYETKLNQSTKEELTNIFQNSKIKIELSDFSCKADKDFIECISPDFKILSQENNDEYKELFKVKNIKFRSNEIYKGKENKVISIKTYYKNLFEKQKNIQTKLIFENLQLEKKIINNAHLSDLDPKINSFIDKLSSDFYTLTFDNSISKKENNYLNKIDINLNSTKLNLNTSVDLNLKEDLFNYLESEEIKFNTQTLTLDKKAINGLFEITKLNQNLNFNDLIQKYIILNNFKIELILKTKGEFDDYIKNAKEKLQTLKIKSQNEEQSLILDKVLMILNNISQNDGYKLNLDLKFKNIPLSEYHIEGINSIEKLNINNQDATDIVKIMFPFLMFSILMGEI